MTKLTRETLIAVISKYSYAAHPILDEILSVARIVPLEVETGMVDAAREAETSDDLEIEIRNRLNAAIEAGRVR